MISLCLKPYSSSLVVDFRIARNINLAVDKFQINQFLQIIQKEPNLIHCYLDTGINKCN
jgi:hypothetical protein